MVITTSQCYEPQNYGQTSLNERLTQWTLQSVWRWSNSRESWNLEAVTMIIFWMPAPIWQSAANSRSKIGTIWMLSRSPRGQWCDTCKARWGTDNWRGQTQAVWQITSKRFNKLVVRHIASHAPMMPKPGMTEHGGVLRNNLTTRKGIGH